MHILAGHDGQPAGFAAMEITVPPYFAGPIPHAHDETPAACFPDSAAISGIETTADRDVRQVPLQH
jgi:hypothetical protein